MSVTDGPLDAYRNSMVQRGEFRPGPIIQSDLFSAMVVDEEDLEIEVPTLAGTVLIVAPETRRSVSYRLDGPKRSTVFRAGYMSLMPRGLAPWWSSNDCAGPMAHIHFAPDAEFRILGDEAVGLCPVSPRMDRVTRRLSALLISCVRAGSVGDALKQDGIATALIAHLTDAYGDVARRSRGTTLTDRQVRRAERRMTEDIGSTVRLEQLAREAGLSPFHFSRAFKAVSGLSPHRFQTVARIERACGLLAGGSAPITEIAATVGYDDPGYFTRVFRREMGLTPSAYRRDLQR